MILRKISIVCLNVVHKIHFNRMSNIKYLNVAEKNDAAKTIAGHLSGGRVNRREGRSQYNKIYEFQTNVHSQNVKMVMTSVSGHLLTQDFPAAYRSWETTNPLSLFSAPVEKMCPERSEKIKETLEREVRGCQALIIWTDCDREGENIGFEIINVCRAIKPNIPVYRAKFSEITTASVRRALNNLEQPDKRQSDAVDVRSELDLRIGAAFTRYQSLRLKKVFPANVNGLVSYGSCQFPTLGFVAHRYKEIEMFVPQTFWKIRVSHLKAQLNVEFNWERNRLFDKACVEAIWQLCQNAEPPAKVKSVVEKPKSKWRPTPMDTVELEKLASRKLKINAKTTMTIAEKLYSQGFISYPRTETNQFSRDINLVELVRGHETHPDWGGFASKVSQWGPNPRNGKKSDQAHPPIHPTKVATTELSGNDKRIYDLIARHFLATLSRDAKGMETVVQIVIADEQFTASGLIILERNYLEVYPYDHWNAKEIHNYRVDEIFTPTEVALQEGSTTAPNLLTEADLIALMEKHGIGTDATHAEHINTIKERLYIGERDGGYLIPGDIGMGLVEGYEAMALTLTEPKLRANLEKDLKAICEGRRAPEDILNEQIQIYKKAYEDVVTKSKKLDDALAVRFNAAPVVLNQAVTTEAVMEIVTKCSSCTQDMILKTKRDGNGFYLSCLRFPSCKNAIWLPVDLIQDVKVLPDNCTQCHHSKLLQFKFKRSITLAMLNSDGPLYSGCIKCDRNLRSVLNLDDQQPFNNNGGGGFNFPRPPAPPRPPPGSGNQWPGNNNQNNNNNNSRPTPSAPWNSNFRNNQNASYTPVANIPSTSAGGPSNGPRSSNSNQPNNKTKGNKRSKPPTINCPHCGNQAILLTTKKDGPNKDRQFYTCRVEHNPPANFFKWADEVQSNNTETGPVRAKRKCSKCKQEGHTRNKCPLPD